MQLLCAFVIAFSMYSRIPMPKVDWSKENMRYMFCFFPMIGGVIGAMMLLWFQYGKLLVGADNLFVVILICLPVLVTGGIHLDGFLDTADALSSYKSMEEKLEILKDSHAGAFAILAGIVYFMLDFGSYSQVTEKMMPVLAMGFVLSRAFSGLAVVSFRKAKNSGLAAMFADASQKRVVGVTMVLYIVLCFLAMTVVGGISGILCFLVAALVFLWYRWLSYRKFGGITGDLAGFFLQICELTMALAMVVAGQFLG